MQIQNDIVDILMAFTQPSLAKEESEEGRSVLLQFVLVSLAGGDWLIIDDESAVVRWKLVYY